MQTTSAGTNNAPRRYADESVLQLLLQYRTTNDSSLRDQIVLQYTNLVESVARRFSAASEPVEDLVQEGFIGLITAIDLYDPTKNVKFSTYATHFIIGQIKHCLRDRGKIIKEPAWLQELNQRITRVIESMTQQFGRQPTHQEIARMMEMTEEAVAEIMMTREVFKVTSIDGGGENEENDGNTVDMDRQRKVDVSVTYQLSVEDRIVLDTAMEKLKDLEQRVLQLFYFKDLNQTEIARQLGISCNYVSHILRNSTKKLRKILVTDDLRATQRKVALLRKREDAPSYAEQRDIVDDLTRLYNRAYFETRLEEELSRASRQGYETTVLLLRLDGLEAFQRAYGSLRYEEALSLAAERLRATIRRADIATRYAEETFAFILPLTGQNAQIVQQRVVAAVQEAFEENGWSEGRAPLTLSSGFAYAPQEATQASKLTRRAFERMQTMPRLVAFSQRRAA